MRRHRAQLLLLAAAAALLSHGGDVVYLGGPSLPALAIRVAWALALAAIAVLSTRLPSVQFQWLAIAAGAGSVLAWVGLAMLTGGSASPYFHWMAAVPLIVGALVPGSVLAVTVTAACTLVAHLLVLAGENAPADSYAVLTSFTCTVGLLAIIGSRLHARVQAAERRSEEMRRRALDDLAVSEHRRLHAEKLALLGKLSSGVAHEINNPLAFVKSNLSMLQETHGATGTCGERAELREILGDCELGIERIVTIIDSLRSFAREDQAGLAPCSVRDAIDEALRLASVSLRSVAKVEWREPADLPPVLANHGHLVQVLVNLLVNAADAIREAGGGPGVVRVEAAAAGRRVTLDVVDSGVGLSPDVAKRLFEPFFTTKPPGKGTGLGLALSREYLQRFDATLEAIQEPDGGARFRIRLQAAVPAGSEAA